MKELILIAACALCEYQPEKSEADILLERAVEICMSKRADQTTELALRCWKREIDKRMKREAKVFTK